MGTVERGQEPPESHRAAGLAAPPRVAPSAGLAAGHVPSADASVTASPAPSGARAVVVGGTAWHVVAADLDPEWVAETVAPDPLAAPLGARFLAALADRVGAEPGSLDAVLVAPRGGRPLDLVPVDDLDHPRVQRALHHRRSAPPAATSASGRPRTAPGW